MKNRIVISNSLPEPKFSITPNVIGYKLNLNVEYLIVPDTYYNVYETIVVDFINTSALIFSFQYPPGQYTYDQFFTLLIADMNLADVVVYSYAYDLITKRITITSTGGVYSLTFPDIISKYLGYGKTTTIVQSVAQEIETDVVDFTRTKTYLVSCTNRYNSETYASFEDSDGLITRSQDIIAIFPTDFNILGALGIRGHVGSVDNNFKISIRDEDNVLIDTNGHRWTISLIYS